MLWDLVLFVWSCREEVSPDASYGTSYEQTVRHSRKSRAMSATPNQAFKRSREIPMLGIMSAVEYREGYKRSACLLIAPVSMLQSRADAWECSIATHRPGASFAIHSGT
jgi:hypothetical protein